MDCNKGRSASRRKLPPPVGATPLPPEATSLQCKVTTIIHFLPLRVYFYESNKEIDYIEEKDGRFTLFEIKSNPKKANTKLPKVFMENYDVEKTAVITPTNWTEWLI